MINQRNQFVDIMRGIAMLLVVLGHTMTGCTVGAEESFLFNIVWSLQMPLFILISGYVTRYSRGIADGKGLWKYVKRRTIAYLLPWAVWSFVVRGIIFGETNFLNVKWLLWHMDSGYWFLATIWTISMIFGVSTIVARKAAKGSETRQQAFTLIMYVIGMAAMTGIGFVAGLSFFAIKLTLYYMPFYFAGYLYGQYRDKILETRWGKTTVDVVVAVCLAVWLFIMTRFHLYALPDSGVAIILRAASSITGCVAVCGLCKGLFDIAPKPLGGGYSEDRNSGHRHIPDSRLSADTVQGGGHALLSDSLGQNASVEQSDHNNGFSGSDHFVIGTEQIDQNGNTGEVASKSLVGGGTTPLVRSSFSGNLSHPLPVTEPAENDGNAYDGKHTGNGVNNQQLRDHGDAYSVVSQTVEHQQGAEVGSVWKQRVGRGFLWAGKKSLEIYMVHGLLLDVLMPESKPIFPSIVGYGLIAGNFAITILLCAVVISLISQSNFLKKILGMK